MSKDKIRPVKPEDHESYFDSEDRASGPYVPSAGTCFANHQIIASAHERGRAFRIIHLVENPPSVMYVTGRGLGPVFVTNALTTVSANSSVGIGPNAGV